MRRRGAGNTFLLAATPTSRRHITRHNMIQEALLKPDTRKAKDALAAPFFDDNSAGEGHARKSLRGGAMAIVARLVIALITIGSVLFLARLLSPEDYGLVSMVTSLTGFATIFVDLGT